MRVSIILIGLALTLGLSTSVWAKINKCHSDKLKVAGKYSFCRLKADSKVPGQTADYTKCDSQYSKKWQRVESKGGCPTEGDEAAIQDRITDDADDIVTLLGGGTLAGCGDGVKNGTEDCDDLDLGGETCEGLGFESGTLACSVGCGLDVSSCTLSAPSLCSLPATGQMTCWDSSGSVIACAGTGHDGDIQAGAALSYIDNGDGTISDLNTGLMWEKKSDDGSIHDQDTNYTWDDAFAVHVTTLNSSTFAGYTDWRLPNVKELISIADYETSSVDPIFRSGCTPGCTVLTCSCNVGNGFYWSSTSAPPSPRAWTVAADVNPFHLDKATSDVEVRAVRGGL